MALLQRSIGNLIRLKSLSKFLTETPLAPRFIMTSSISHEKAMEKLKTNPYFEKYASKIAILQQTSPEEFLSRLETTVKSQMKPGPEQDDSNKCSTVASSRPKGTPSQYRAKSLSDVMKTELTEDKSAAEITEIWQEYYKMKDGLAATIPGLVYSSMIELAREHPMFLFALPRSNGYEFMVCQWLGDEAHFTSLINYQAYQENAPECLTLHHYTELLDDKGIVLMRGEYDSNLLNANEARCLVNQLQLYYSQPNEKRSNLLQCFTHNPANFKHMDLIAELECLSI